MTTDTKLLTDAELSRLGERLRANQDILVDPVIVNRLYDTLMHYRDAVVGTCDQLLWSIRDQSGDSHE